MSQQKNVNLNSVKGKNILQKYIENIRFSMRGGSKHLFSSFKTDLENYIIKYPHMTYLNDVYDTKLYNSINSINTPLKIGTDCSGIEAPIMALELLKIPHIHEFSSDLSCPCPPPIFPKNKHKHTIHTHFYAAGLQRSSPAASPITHALLAKLNQNMIFLLFGCWL